MSDDWSGQADKFAAYTKYAEECATETGVKTTYKPVDWTTLGQQQPIIMSSDKYVVDILDLGVTDVFNYGRQGKLVALDDLLPSDMLQKWLQGPLNTGKVGGKLYGLCVWPSWMIGFYNKELYEKAGLDPSKGPATLGEMEEHIIKLQAITKQAYLDTWTDWHWTRVFHQLVFAKDGNYWQGGTADNPDEIKWTFTTPQCKEALQWMRHMYQDKLLSPDSVNLSQQDIADRFALGDVGLTFNWEGFAAILEKPDVSKVIGKVGAFGFPGDKPGKAVAQSGFEYMCIPTSAKNPKGAAAWMTCINKPEIIKARALSQYYNPVYTDMYNDPEIQKKLFYWNVIKEIESRTLPQNFYPKAGEVSSYLQGKIQEVVMGTGDIDAVLEDLQKFAEEKSK